VIGEAPVAPVEPGHDHGVRAVVEEFAGGVHAALPCVASGAADATGLRAPSPRAAAARSSPSSSSRRAGTIFTHMRLLFTSTTGASPHAPKHSPSFRVNMPSALV